MSRIGNDTLDALIILSSRELIDQNINALLAVNAEAAECPASLDRRIKRMLRRERRERKYGKVTAMLGRAAAILLVVGTIASVSVMCVDGMRSAVIRMVTSWFDAYAEFDYYAEGGTVHVPSVIEEKREPTGMPAEWERTGVVDSLSMYGFTCRLNGVRQIAYMQTCLSVKTAVDNDDVETEKVTVGHGEGMLFRFTDSGIYAVYWTDGEYAYSIKSFTEDASREQVLALAESVK